MTKKKTRQDHKAEWVPKDGGQEYTTNVMGGVVGGHDGLAVQEGIMGQRSKAARRQQLKIEDYVQGVLAGDRSVLARTITLIESNAAKHLETAQEVMHRLLPYTGNSLRIGITGVPGAGKSTFIEALGNHLCDQGCKLAVLAVDPSSSITKGSILGDKTRMENLARRPESFIRPSPSGGTLGGVTRKSRETILACEAAGYNVIFVETVGVGQSEVTVRSLVDIFLLLVITGAGDELQGMKKGVMELADAIIVNKADGDNLLRAETAKADYDQMLHYLRPATPGWVTHAHTCSSIYSSGIAEIWNVIQIFQKTTKESGVFDNRRKKQTMDWVHTMLQEYLENMFFGSPLISKMMPVIEQEVLMGKMSATMAAFELIHAFENNKIKI